MKRMLSFLLIGAMLMGIVSMTGCGKLDPNAIAAVKTGETTETVESVEALLAAVDPSGNSYITFYQDVQTDSPIRFPYSCTIDLNGHTVSTNPNHGNALVVLAAGSENPVSCLKNGKLVHYGQGIEVQQGGLQVEGMTFCSSSGAPVSLQDPDPAYRTVNKITGSTLCCGTSPAVIFSMNSADYTGAGIAIDNSMLVCPAESGAYAFLTRGTAGTVELGENVDIYTYGDTLAQVGFYFGGMIAPKSPETKTVDVNGTSYSGLNHWSTANKNEAVNLLMIGNSFCYYFVEELYGIAQAAGQNINVTNLYEAGCRIDEHWAWLSNEQNGADKYEFWLTNSMGRYRHGDIRTSYEALKYLDWQQISVQQHFTPGKAKTYEVAMESCTPFAKNVYDYIKNSNPDAQLYWQAHWAFQVGHDTVPDVGVQTMQYTNARAASVTICEDNGVSMIPTGDAWQLARADSLFGDTLCKSDNLHDGESGGQYLNACVWYEVLTGKSCVGNTWRPTYDLSEEKIVALQNHAHAAVAGVYGADYAK